MASGRVRDVIASGEPATGNTKAKAARSLQELITKADIRAVCVICATACLSLFLLEFVGGEDMVQKIQEGWTDYDAVIATPDMMKSAGRLGKVLGPRGMMPNPKTGTVTFEVANADDMRYQSTT